MAELDVHADVVAEVAARLDLREPNRLAVETIAAEVSQYFDVDGREAPFEAVLDVATGVGKTYVMVGAMEFLVEAHDVSDFVVIVPGTTILNKTRDNFSPGNAKSLLDAMSFSPVVITADNFNTPAMGAAMSDPNQVKIYLFTVQSLLRPKSTQGRRVHKFQEGLGTEFYGHLQAIEKLTVFADEHHAYYAPAFSAAVRDLNPWVLLGLTATPHKQTPAEQIIYRYPLAAAIADRHVKTPVIVGRKDDRTDSLTKLTDGVTLLRAKAEAVASYTAATDARSVNPVMLVVAKSIADAEEYGEILRSTEFFNGDYAEAVLVVHSDVPDIALAALAAVEDDASPVRIIISVGMLKEGWDVRSVYVIASMRSSVSEILTEQTLGRGMRLPFGKYTDVEILDTLEVIAHEKYSELLQKSGVLNEAFVDHRTRAVLRYNAQGQQVVTRETTPVHEPLFVLPESAPSASLDPSASQHEYAVPMMTSFEERAGTASKATLKMKQDVVWRVDAPMIEFPVLKMTVVKSSFSLADITDTDGFSKLGRALAMDPEGELNRTLLGARVVTGRDGIKRTELVTSTGADRVRTAATLFPIDDLRTRLEEMVLASPSIPARKNERAALQPILDAFVTGLGAEATAILSANLDRAGARLIRLIETEQRRFMSKPSYEEVVEVRPFSPKRVNDKDITKDRHGTFSRQLAYEGWHRSTFPIVWFDSSPERTVANMVDDDDTVSFWTRLHINDLPILWNSAGQNYNPDLLVIEADGTHWVVEVKMDKEIDSADVIGKRAAAKRWANHVSADSAVGQSWKYLLASEADVKTARGSWRALKQLAS